jgi:carboxymethylenebutenolidase
VAAATGRAGAEPAAPRPSAAGRRAAYSEIVTSVRVSVDGGEMPADLHLPAGDRGPGIVLFQEIFGVTDYIDGRARDLAGLGYVVLVPHVYWRQGDPVISGDGALDRAMAARGKVDWDTAVGDGVAAVAALRQRDEVAGPTGVFGFCFGGGLAFAVAAADDPDFLVSYYGTALPDLLEATVDVRAPSLHHFGLDDAYIPAETVEQIERALTSGPAPTTVLTYDDAGHAFDNPMPAFHQAQASRRAWDNTVTWLARTAPTD